MIISITSDKQFVDTSEQIAEKRVHVHAIACPAKSSLIHRETRYKNNLVTQYDILLYFSLSFRCTDNCCCSLFVYYSLPFCSRFNAHVNFAHVIDARTYCARPSVRLKSHFERQKKKKKRTDNENRIDFCKYLSQVRISKGPTNQSGFSSNRESSMSFAENLVTLALKRLLFASLSTYSWEQNKKKRKKKKKTKRIKVSTEEKLCFRYNKFIARASVDIISAN
ncbi:hypothetical protein PUN28_012848 [Cardiocondyla obscurior]|uniref:Uncharacterized protein n=1 Tax=Cardiocondyla obscurior TaxID=286306 RepID=A0AAW2FAN9_9HYME